MKSMFVAAALTIGMASAALAEQTASASSQGVVMPNQRASFLAHHTLAQNDVVMPNQRASYLAHYTLAQNDVVMPNQRASYLTHYDLA